MRTASDANPVTLDELRQLAACRFGDMVKAVVDLRLGVMLLDADLHADQEAELLASGSAPEVLRRVRRRRPPRAAAGTGLTRD